MNKVLVLAVLLALNAVALLFNFSHQLSVFAQDKPADEASAKRNFVDRQYGFTLELPKTVEPKKDSALTLCEWKLDQSEELVPLMSVRCEMRATTADALEKEAKADLEKAGFKGVTVKRIKVSNCDALSTDVTFDQNGTKCRFRNVAVVEANKILYLEYFGTQKHYVSHEKDISAAFDSFKLANVK